MPRRSTAYCFVLLALAVPLASVPSTLEAQPVNKNVVNTYTLQSHYLIVDRDNINNGTFTSAGSFPGIRFGRWSGEGIGSMRAAQANRYGLDFYTGFSRKMSLSHDGDLMVGTLFPLARLTLWTGQSQRSAYLLNETPNQVIGLHNIAKSEQDGMRWGIYNVAWSNNQNPGPVYALYSKSYHAGPNDWAGFFDGRVYSSQGFIASDARLKQNVTPIADAIGIVTRLRGVSYLMNPQAVPSLELPSSRQYGLIAQEVEKVVPDLVTEVKYGSSPAMDRGEAGTAQVSTTFKALDYNGLIPILVEAFKQQQTKIGQLEARLRRFEVVGPGPVTRPDKIDSPVR